MSHLLIYGFNIESIELSDIEKLSTYRRGDARWVKGVIEIPYRELPPAEVHADVELSRLSDTELEKGNDFVRYFLDKLGPWLLRKDEHHVRIPGSVKKSVGGFTVVMMPVDIGD